MFKWQLPTIFPLKTHSLPPSYHHHPHCHHLNIHCHHLDLDLHLHHHHQVHINSICWLCLLLVNNENLQWMSVLLLHLPTKAEMPTFRNINCLCFYSPTFAVIVCLCGGLCARMCVCVCVSVCRTVFV